MSPRLSANNNKSLQRISLFRFLGSLFVISCTILGIGLVVATFLNGSALSSWTTHELSRNSLYEASDYEDGCSAYASVRGDVYDVKVRADVDDMNCDVVIEFRVIPFGYVEGRGTSHTSCGSASGVAGSFLEKGWVSSFADGCGDKQPL